jgi:hypothetical protein
LDFIFPTVSKGFAFWGQKQESIETTAKVDLKNEYTRSGLLE